MKEVPKDTIAVFYKQNCDMNDRRMERILYKAETTRDWFPKELSKSSPLIAANDLGFLISAEYTFKVHWNGGDKPEDLTITIPNAEAAKYGHPDVVSTFGSGVFTVNVPFVFRTPPNVNLLSINPPNYILPLSTVLSSMIQTDSLNSDFTFNVKIQVPDAEITFPAGHPLAAFIPIPKYFIEKFDLVPANEIFSDKEIKKDLSSYEEPVELKGINIYSREERVVQYEV